MPEVNEISKTGALSVELEDLKPKSYPELSFEEEKTLIEKIQSDDKENIEEVQQAMDIIVSKYWNMIRDISKAFMTYNAASGEYYSKIRDLHGLEDVFSQGLSFLLEAIKKYQPLYTGTDWICTNCGYDASRKLKECPNCRELNMIKKQSREPKNIKFSTFAYTHVYKELRNMQRDTSYLKNKSLRVRRKVLKTEQELEADKVRRERLKSGVKEFIADDIDLEAFRLELKANDAINQDILDRMGVTYSVEDNVIVVENEDEITMAKSISILNEILKDETLSKHFELSGLNLGSSAEEASKNIQSALEQNQKPPESAVMELNMRLLSNAFPKALELAPKTTLPISEEELSPVETEKEIEVAERPISLETEVPGTEDFKTLVDFVSDTKQDFVKDLESESFMEMVLSRLPDELSKKVFVAILDRHGEQALKTHLAQENEVNKSEISYILKQIILPAVKSVRRSEGYTD